MPTTVLADHLRADVQTLWEYHDMGHRPRRCDVGIGLGSHDLGVATYTAELYHQGLFGRIVFTGANTPTTIKRFPRGEAVHYREHAISLGVPAEVISIETEATNTSENLTRSRKVLEDVGVRPASVLLISRPYQQRRAYATCRKVWPDVDVVCGSRTLPLDDYIAGIGDVDRVINMLVGDTQRITEYARRGFAVEQHMPKTVHAAKLSCPAQTVVFGLSVRTAIRRVTSTAPSSTYLSGTMGRHMDQPDWPDWGWRLIIKLVVATSGAVLVAVTQPIQSALDWFLFGVGAVAAALVAANEMDRLIRYLASLIPQVRLDSWPFSVKSPCGSC